MNLGASAIVLRPRSVSEIMDLACRFVFDKALGLYARLAATFILPFYVGVLLLRYLLKLEWYWTWLIALPIAIWVQGPFTIAVSRMMFGERPTTMAIIKAFGARFFSYSVAMMLKLFYITLSMLLCGIGQFFIAPAGTLVPEATLLEGASAWEAWGRSRRMVTQRAGDSFGALAALVIVLVSFTFGFELLGQALVDFVLQIKGEPLGAVFWDGISPYALAGLFVSAPFIATARFLHYIDTRTRADGWDIQVKFMAVVAKVEEARMVSEAKVGGRA